jgi:uncharacterized membrane protein
MTTSIWSIITVNIANIFAALGSYFLKKSSKNLKLSLSTIIGNKSLIIGVILYILSSVLFIPSLKYGELSILYPFVALSYVWVIVFSTKLLKEKMNSFKWIGVFLIIIGVVFIGLGSG